MSPQEKAIKQIGELVNGAGHGDLDDRMEALDEIIKHAEAALCFLEEEGQETHFLSDTDHLTDAERNA